ncbi:Cys-rich peptide radical SAM maturase CcpM [Paenibacillus macerans]|uniref:Cys-rich peptide radical SAM maturase CcpM n=1 Tax=Paenibacillus macerans TaxID=44252 RepID=UPI002DBE666D|nr:Cys-rich peptide radical SAM maturase CcpM [Paenibacillus macerans]MEC0331736.1 Cys-rich peptide radical SAM maturase CcpM [Paenibacillus macerans]
MNDRPFVHVFSMVDEYFLYDVNKNNILQIDYLLYKYLKDGNVEVTDESLYLSIDRLKKRGYLSGNRIEKIEHPMSKLIHSYLTSKLQSICLQVTQDCNLRCAYCVYSGDYNNRTHDKKMMSLKTAKKAVDFLIKNSSESDIICIGFYGGEPLLNFEVIKETVLYATKKYPGKDYYFTLTTNGTVIKENYMKFLEEHQFALTISIDGNKEMHDVNRKFKNSGKGSFEAIMKNIQKIRECYPNLSSKLMFSVVLSVSSDFTGCNEFFTNTDILKDTELAVSTVSNRYKEGNPTSQGESNIISQRYEIFKCILILIGKLDENNCSNMVKNYYYKLREHYKQFYITENGVEPISHPAGPCIPGAFRLFVNVDENFYPCEKVSEISSVSKIGDLQNGFNFKNIDTMLNVGRVGNDMCKNCWAYRYCKVCISSIDNLTHLSIEKKEECCKRIKKEVEMMMQEYCFVSKHNAVKEG